MRSIPLLPALLRGLHILSVCAWLGGGLGVILLLLLGRQTESAEELQAYNLVITAIDDHLISPGAASTVMTGLLLTRARKNVAYQNHWLLAKLIVTIAALSFGSLALAPWLRELLEISRQDGLAVFDDHIYRESYLWGMVGSLVQMTALIGLLGGSVAQRATVRVPRKCGGCPPARTPA